MKSAVMRAPLRSEPSMTTSASQSPAMTRFEGGKAPGPRGQAPDELAEQQPAGQHAGEEPRVAARIDDVHAAAEDADGGRASVPGRSQGGLLGDGVDAHRQPAHDDDSRPRQIGGDGGGHLPSMCRGPAGADDADHRAGAQ